MKTDRAYNLTVATYNLATVVNREENCIGFMFTNLGDTVAFVNEMVIFPSATPLTALGDSRTIMAHNGEVYKGNIRLSFRQPVGVQPLVEIVQLFYAEEK